MSAPPPDDRPLRAAMVRFPTIPRARWRDVVSALAELGFDAIDVPLVWREHERAPGVFDFTEGRLDVAAMFDAVTAAKLRLVVRLGPNATDDAPGLCVPERVLYDRACQARTRRQNAVLVPDPPRAVPLPSVASEAFRREACAWVSAAAAAVARAHGAVARVIVGDGPHALLRDDPFEIDHHPDARGELAATEPPHDGPRGAALAEVRRERDHAVRYREALLDAAQGAGLAGAFVAVHGAATISPAAHRLARAHGVVLAAPPPIAGTAAIWRQVRHAVALASARGLHLDVWSGGPPFYPPTRASHTLDAARVALAAGARDVTVRMGCAGERWVGAVISEEGRARPQAPGWRELLAWAEGLPRGADLAAELAEPEAIVEAARAATGVHPMPLGLLALVGITPGQLATPRARASADGRRGGDGDGDGDGDGETLAARELRIASHERALALAGVPARRTPVVREGALHPREAEDPEAFAARARRSLADVAPTIEPAGAALVRAVRGEGRVHVVVVSKSHEPARVTPPATDGGGAWRRDGREPDAGDAGPVELAPGAAVHFSRDEAPARSGEPAAVDTTATATTTTTTDADAQTRAARGAKARGAKRKQRR